MTNVFTTNLTASGTGSLLIVLNPHGVVRGATLGTVQATFPWLSTSVSATNTPYAGGATIFPPPFSASAASIQGGYPDISNVKFNCTLPPINASGQVFSTTFY